MRGWIDNAAISGTVHPKLASLGIVSIDCDQASASTNTHTRMVAKAEMIETTAGHKVFWYEEGC